MATSGDKVIIEKSEDSVSEQGKKVAADQTVKTVETPDNQQTVEEKEKTAATDSGKGEGKDEESGEQAEGGESEVKEKPAEKEQNGQANDDGDVAEEKMSTENEKAEGTGQQGSGETEKIEAAAAVTVLKAGLLTKQGGSYRNWKKYYFVLSENSLSYYKKEGDTTPKRRIDLTTGRGVRTPEQCNLEWPKSAKPSLSFGVATEERTFYIYGDNEATVKEWMTQIQQCIDKVGHPNDDYKNDPEGKPEGKLSKFVKGGAKLASKVTKLVAKNAGVDEDVVNVVEGVADAAENQADADRDATLTDRLKIAGGDAAGVVGDNTDNAYVSVAADVVQEQCEADADTSIQQRVLMGAGTAVQGTGEALCEEGEGNEDMKIAGGVLIAAGKVVKDQAEADEDLSLKQRAALAGGSAIGGTSEALGATLGDDVQPLVDALDVTSGVVKDQATADEDTSLKDRGLLAISSTAGGMGELESVKDTGVKEITDAVQQAADEAKSSE